MQLGWTPVSGRIAVKYFIEPTTGFLLIDSLLSDEKGAFWSALSTKPPSRNISSSELAPTVADVAREAADFVLLEQNLDVIRRGIEEGRRTFANTLKYILTTTSANLGNMLSMAVAATAIPYKPPIV